MKIAITGHRPDAFLVSHYSIETIERIAEDTVCILKREYGDDLSFNLGGAVGADQWVGDACIEHDVNFRMFLPFLPNIQAKFWNKEQRNNLDLQLQKAAGINIVNLKEDAEYTPKTYMERNMNMVDDASFAIAFWVGKRRGGTFQTIKYALSQSKFVLNALDNLRPIFKESLDTGWTPPTFKNGEDV